VKPWEATYEVGIDAKFAEQDKRLGLPAGKTRAQFTVESGMKPDAVSPAGARGWAQIMPNTQATLEKRAGRKFDPANLDDALAMHEMVMRENIQRFGNVEDALKAYNGGWNKAKWDNPETSAYVPKIKAAMNKKSMPWEAEYEPITTPASSAAPGPAGQEAAILPPMPKVGTAKQVGMGAVKGVKDLIDGLAYLLPKGLEQAASLGGAVPNAASRWFGSEAARVSDMNKVDDAEFKQITGDSAAANAARIGGNIATAFIPGTGQAQLGQKAAQLWNAGSRMKSLVPAAGLGATQGAVLNTRTEDDSALANAAGGAAGGVVGQAAMPVVKAAGNLASGVVKPFFKGGRESIVRNTLNQFAANPNINPAQVNLPGVQLTAADATGDAGLAQLQRALQSASPEFAATLSEIRKGNNASMVGALRDIAGDDAAKQAAEQARRVGTNPLYAQVDKSTRPVDADVLLSKINQIAQKNAPRSAVAGPVLQAQKAISEAMEAGAAPGAMQRAGLAVDDLRQAKNPDGSPANRAAMRELNVIKALIDRSITRVEPAFGQAQAAYRDLSRPINQQQIAQRLLDTKTSALRDAADNPRMQAEAFARALRSEDQLIKQSTGRRGLGGLDDVMEPEQMQTLRGIVDVLSRQAEVERAGAITGSKTAQLGAAQNALRGTLGPLGLASMSGAPALSMLPRLMDAALKAPNQAIQDRLSEVILSPQLTQQLLQQANKPKPVSDAASRAMQRALTASGALSGAAVAQQ
jgi:hypothetical protein